MLMESLTLDKAVDVARQWETVKRESAELTGKHSAEVARIQNNPQQQMHKNKKKQPHKTKGGGHGNQQEKQESKPICWNCGQEGHFAKARDKCPAVNSTCSKCQKKGHYAKCCRKKDVQEIKLSCHDDKYLFSVHSDSQRKQRWRADVQVNGQAVNFKLDPGADVTVLPYVQWKRTFTKVKLKPTTVHLRGADESTLEIVGTFTAKLEYNKQSLTQEVYVVKRAGTALLGLEACEDLGLVARVQVEQLGQTGVNPWKEFPKLFQGLGKLKEKYSIKLKPDSQPYAVNYCRRVPLPMMEKLKTELQDMVSKNVIEQVDEPTPWCAPLVITSKPNGSIRICVDLQKLNECVERELHMLPMVEHELGKLGGAKFFSKLDANSGFWQIPLSKHTAKLTTFITPFGRYFFKRLPFGISSAPEHFQKRMSSILRGLEGVVCLMDDILIHGSTQQEHDERLRKVLARISESGLSLNKSKCQFGLTRVRFLGHIVDEEGIHPDEEKVKAVMEMGEPENVKEVRQLLGHLNYLAKFIPNLSAALNPLHVLLKAEAEWLWEEPQKRAFDEVKRILASEPVLATYDMKKDTIVSADASSFGIGAVLKQKQKDGSWRPVCYASRTLTDAETRYAQIEKEALGITWACDRFKDFLIGLEFQVETDHKPLLSIFKKKDLGELTPRLQRFRMRMMHFSFKIFHTPGKDLLAADFLSRHPLKSCDPYELESEVQEHVRHVVMHIETHDNHLGELAVAQETDSMLQKVTEYVVSGWPEKRKLDGELKSFYEIRDELAIVEGLLVRGNRLVIPHSHRKEILWKLHEGHQGIVKCRARAKMCVWWPNLSTEIESMIRKCEVCTQERPAKREPLMPSEFPQRPWQKLGMDLFHHDGLWYLVVCDFFSRYPEMVTLKNMSGETVIRHLKSIFSRHGVPEEVYSDNGTQFSPSAASLFQKFAKEYGFRQKTSSPKFPQSNGFAECAVRIVKNALKKNVDVYKALLEYRATPLANGYSPAELLFGRKLRTTLPCHTDILKPGLVNQKVVRELEDKRRSKQKENFDRRHGAKEKPEFSGGEKVWVRDRREWGVILKKADAPRSYWIKTDSGTYRRNSFHLESAGRREDDEFDVDLQPEEENEVPQPERQAPDSSQQREHRNNTQSRFGRRYKPVTRLNYTK